MINDEDIIRAVRAQGIRHAGSEWAYTIDDVRHTPGELDVRVRMLSGIGVRAKLSLPSSGRLQPWLFAEAADADDWVDQLQIWLDEQVLTGGLQWAAQTRIDGADYVSVEAYGWRKADPAEHERLSHPRSPAFGERLNQLRSWCREVRACGPWYFAGRD